MSIFHIMWLDTSWAGLLYKGAVQKWSSNISPSLRQPPGPLPCPQLLFLAHWFPCLVVAAVSKALRLLYVWFCLVLFWADWNFWSPSAFGELVAPLWDTRNVQEGNSRILWCLLLPILFAKQKAYLLWFFWGGNRKGYREEKDVKIQLPPPPLVCPSSTLRPLVNLWQKRATSRLRARGGFQVRRGRYFLGSCFLCAGAINGVNWVKAPPGTAVLYQILADPHNFDRAPTVGLGS